MHVRARRPRPKIIKPMSVDYVSSAAAALLAKLDGSEAMLDDRIDQDAGSELHTLTLAVRDLEKQVGLEEAQIALQEHECEGAAAALADAKRRRLECESQLQQQRRTQARQRASAKLLQLQLTVATQLHGVAESLTQVAAAASGPAKTKGGSRALLPLSDALRHRDREIEELRRALKRQEQLTADAHRQILELSTRKRPPKASAASAPDDLHDLRASLAEQEMRRLMAEARVDELLAQVRLFEEQGLRARLHPPSLGSEAKAGSPGAGLSPTSQWRTPSALEL